ncbi:MAG: hypothetical protein VW804_02250 [Verrucomicrobiota bacterium]
MREPLQSHRIGHIFLLTSVTPLMYESGVYGIDLKASKEGQKHG